MFSSSLLAQSFKGKVVDINSGEGVFGVSIYYKGTTIGTISGHEGTFDMRTVPGENIQVVFARFGYETKEIDLITDRELIVELKAIEGFSDVYKNKLKDRQWQRQYKQFEKALIGESNNAKNVEVLNPQVVELVKSGNGQIIAVVNEPLQIRNAATGYQLYFFFEGEILIDGMDAQYNGVPYFVKLEPENEKQLDLWKVNRKSTYEGSLQHFLYSLISNTLYENGFEVSFANRDSNSGRFVKGADIAANEILIDGKISFDNYLRIKYTKEKPQNEFINSFTTTTRFGTRSRNGQSVENLFMENIPDRDGQVSFLFSRMKYLEIDSLGILKSPEALLEYGYWSWERIAELMPIEYHLEYIETKK